MKKALLAFVFVLVVYSFTSTDTAFAGTTSANFAASAVSGPSPFSVTFINESSGAANWLWSFGDGTQSGDMNPTHIYTQPGTYSVSLAVWSSGGWYKSLAKKNYIHVITPNESNESDLTPKVIAAPSVWPALQPPPPTVGANNISLTVYNAGGAAAPAFYVGFYALPINPPPTLPIDPGSSSAIFMGGINLDPLAAGAYESVIVESCMSTPGTTVCIDPPGALLGGSYYIGVVIDPIHQLPGVNMLDKSNVSSTPTSFPSSCTCQ
jgi:hypothetical protein